MSITVLDIESIDPESEGDAEARRFMNAQTVGAEIIEGTAYRLAPGGSLGPLKEDARYQLFYVTSGKTVGLYQGERHRLAVGQGVYCDPGETCAFENPTDTPAAFYRFVIKRS